MTNYISSCGPLGSRTLAISGNINEPQGIFLYNIQVEDVEEKQKSFMLGSR
jgi:hypothetical protein